MTGLRANLAYGYGESNYDNEKVQEIKRQFGDFKYPNLPQDGARRAKQDERFLENGAKYTGEWNLDINKRDGRG